MTRGTGTPKDKDEVNRREVCECDGANLIRVLQAACLLIRVFEAACKKFLRQQVRISMTVLTSYLLPSISMTVLTVTCCHQLTSYLLPEEFLSEKGCQAQPGTYALPTNLLAKFRC